MLFRFQKFAIIACAIAAVCAMRQRMKELSDPAYELDGRKGWQWTASAISYLQYRAGRDWRPARHRFNPEHEYFVSGINLLNQLQNALPMPCACAYCVGGAVFVDAKKPVARVRAAKAANRNRA